MKINLNRSMVNQTALLTLRSLALSGLVCSAQAADPVSQSDLLEKGIYSQETKGDLDAAIGLYEKVVAEGKDTQALAAQAEYRLGVCYYKKKDYAKATAAFEKLIKDYADQKELVALAREYLAGAADLIPAPWIDGELLRLDLKFGSGFKIGPATYTVHAGEANGRKVWNFSSRLFAGVQQLSSVEADAESMKPLHSRWKHTLLGDVDAVYGQGTADLKFKNKDEVKKIDFEGVVYDNEEAAQLMRRLPLTTNYSKTIHIVSTLAGGTVFPLKLDVAAIEKLEVPAGTFECYRVELNIHQTFWISTDSHRYLVKFEANGVTAELLSVTKVSPGQPVRYQVPSQEITLAAPAGWLFDTYDPEDANSATKTVILDPEAAATSFLFVRSLDKLKDEEKKSLRACAEAQIAEGSKTLKDVKVRADSWKELTVAGHPAVSFVADFVEGKEKKTDYSIFSFINGNEVAFMMYTAPADFEGFRKDFGKIVNSLEAGKTTTKK